MAKIHNLLGMSMERAYDKTQCSDDIKPGDFLLVDDGIAMMDGAWPVMISGVSGVFHAYHDNDEGRALRAAALAQYKALEAGEAGEAPAPAAALILSTTQAEEVYSAMCHLNNVYGKLDVGLNTHGSGFVQVRETPSGEVWIHGGHGIGAECYPDQAAFAAAYGLGA